MILTEATLFFHNYSSKNSDKTGLISNWASEITVESGNDSESIWNGSSTTIVAKGTSANDVVITTKEKKRKGQSKTTVRRDDDIFGGNENGERVAAISSPTKGGKKPTYAVSHILHCDIILMDAIL